MAQFLCIVPVVLLWLFRFCSYFTVSLLAASQLLCVCSLLGNNWGIVGYSSENNWLVFKEYRNRIIGYNCEHNVLRPIVQHLANDIITTCPIDHKLFPGG